jgi:hypothetical protein
VRRSSLRRTPLLGAALLLAVVAPSVARAQAWLPTKGEGAIGLTFGDYSFDGHFDGTGQRIPFGGTRALSAAGDLLYGITDRFAVAGSLPFITSKFTGTFPKGVLLGPLDFDRRYHGDFQDFRFEARFMAITGELALTPLVGVNLPSHNYEVVGEAVPGKRTKEAYLGFAAGRSLDPFLSKGYVHLRYTYSFVEKVVPNVRKLDRSNIDAEFGYAAADRLSLRAFGAWQITHGGLNLESMFNTPDLFRTHDRATRTDYFNLGVGATLQASPGVELYTAFVKTISGENAHQARSFYLGAAFWFGGGFGGGRSAPLRSVRQSLPRPKACPLC